LIDRSSGNNDGNNEEAPVLVTWEPKNAVTGQIRSFCSKMGGVFLDFTGVEREGNPI
jgi:hypothetical protein